MSRLLLAALVLSLPSLACSKPAEETPAVAAAELAAPANVKRVDIAVTDGGFSPSTVDLKKGEPVVLRFTRTTKSECLKAIAIPDLKVEKDLPLNTPVEVAVTPEKEGKMVLQCWMGMVKATLNVVGA
ncbi:MAG TPA: cupredoxin domain-containing protein [Sorangium sp.]|uniref:cupredoxin domain-containing protein n=1 Tax=Sorangium sp. So ce1153 TaxID=3133333 RepID=UPI002D068A1C|nr:cupredoxin domain-containing protein [Sorangium sp.]